MVIVVVGLAGAVMIAVPVLVTDAVHVPAPVAAIVAVPPGALIQFTVWAGPASGMAVTTIAAVSVQPVLVQMKL